MKKIIYILFLFFSLVACRKSDGKPENTVIGSTLVDLNAEESYIRKQEAELANFISDALYEYYKPRFADLDFVVTNGGNIRYDENIRPNGIYKIGNITSEMVDEMLPFGNTSTIIQLTGLELKSVFERSVAQYPLAKGPFLQCSKDVKVFIDTLKSPQLINIEENQIIQSGSRIDSIYFKNNKVHPDSSYFVLFSDYIGDGFDGYVTLQKIGASRKFTFQDNQTNAVKECFILKSPINPSKEGRIKFN